MLEKLLKMGGSCFLITVLLTSLLPILMYLALFMIGNQEDLSLSGRKSLGLLIAFPRNTSTLKRFQLSIVYHIPNIWYHGCIRLIWSKLHVFLGLPSLFYIALVSFVHIVLYTVFRAWVWDSLVLYLRDFSCTPQFGNDLVNNSTNGRIFYGVKLNRALFNKKIPISFPIFQSERYNFTCFLFENEACCKYYIPQPFEGPFWKKK